MELRGVLLNRGRKKLRVVGAHGDETLLLQSRDPAKGWFGDGRVWHAANTYPKGASEF